MPNDDALSQQEREFMEDIAHFPDDPVDPDAWMWSFDDEDASKDATKKVRQNALLTIYPAIFR
jgi:hypothetical protein